MSTRLTVRQVSSHLRNRAIPFLVTALLIATGLLLADSGANHQAKQSLPIKLGTSGGNVNNISAAFCCSGTLGSLVQDTSGAQYILSNNHVLADTDTGHVGDDISQPGLVDVGCNASQANIVADLNQWIRLGTKNVDAAIALARSGSVDTTGAILDVGVPASASASGAIGLGVAKSGRTTGLTCASISSINTNVSVQYQRNCGTGQKFVITYKNQIAITSSGFSAGGDSGSLIVTSGTAQPTGLLFAGSSTTTIANPVSDVLAAFSGFTFVGGGTHAVTCPTGGKPAAAALSPASVDRATAAKDEHADRLMADPAVIGVGVGASSEDPSEAVVVIYLEQGRAHRPIPSELNGVRTEVIRTDAFRAYGWNEPERKACSAK